MKIDRSNPWLCITETKVRPECRLFCFPYAGGSAEMFFNWQQAINPTIQLCMVQLPGRSYRVREFAYNNLELLVDQLKSVLVPYCDRPFAVFGHSLGGLIGFEVLRSLTKEVSQYLKGFFVSARYAPQSNFTAKVIHRLPDKEFIQAIVDLGGAEEKLFQNTNFIELMLPMLRADFSLSENYIYKPCRTKLLCPIIGLGGIYDTLLPVDSMLAWEKETDCEYRLYKFAGDHFFIKPFATEVINILNEYLIK